MIQVSGVAIGEWSKNCVKQNSRTQTIKKILRAYNTGTLSHRYKDGSYIIRYYNLNLLVSVNGIIMTVWRDNTREFANSNVFRSDYSKQRINIKKAQALAEIKHQNILSVYIAN